MRSERKREWNSWSKDPNIDRKIKQQVMRNNFFLIIVIVIIIGGYLFK